VSGNTESLRKKIDSAGDLKGVVRSMKALAASSIAQYERAVVSLDHYYRTVELGLVACFRLHDPAPPEGTGNHRSVVPVGAVIFGSDQGLVGRFNDELVEFAMRGLKALPGKTTRIWAVGERIQALIGDSNPVQASLMPVPTSVNGIASAVGQILIEIEGAREKGEIAELYFFHNRQKSGGVYEPVMRRLIPLDRVWQDSLTALPWPTKSIPEIIGDRKAVLEAFTRGYLFILLFRACAESLASENASRLAAMQRADKNIGEILEDLNRTFHRVRQESIDDELFDVISGYEALSEAKNAMKTTQ
jgi:F-type H+-transporting ATPase subunit gamma